MGPRDPIERELLRQQGDLEVLAEDPGWLKLAGSRCIPNLEPLDLVAYRAWLRHPATLATAVAWLHTRTELRQKADPALPRWRDQVRWVVEFALLKGPGDQHRRAYLSELALTRAVEHHDRMETMEALRMKTMGNNGFVLGPIHWQWVLDWVGENLPFPDHPPSM